MARTVALVGAGDVAKYFVEEFLRVGYKVIVLSRAARPWFSDRPDIIFCVSDYTTASFLEIFDTYTVEAVFCLIHDNSFLYTSVHESILSACTASKTAKRFVPSEYDGNIDVHWDKPRFHLHTHVPFRERLARQDAIKYTLLCHGWFMDYVVPADKIYLKDIYPVWPVDINNGFDDVVIPGSGEEAIGLTAARDVARVGAQLLEVPEWTEKTYVCGEYTTWNVLIAQLGRFYGRRFNIVYKPVSGVQKVMDDPAATETALNFAYMEEWNFSGASAPPKEQLLSEVRLRSVAELLEDGKRGGVV
ncbi:hypothetical protein K488DRAFT_58538 [Vararia minispora EC-137]|uniref:Uncharacterized protein n=1 Tax=Vararia minispora EC-137 TaxID=1314806 RepID=A0ACB8Q9F8_9AGAM|nr:hypothetical protein K488DRAFT_58538 [Vararia minispora EC-137]